MACDVIRYLAGQSADSWVAVWTFALFGATLLLGLIALSQISEGRKENRITQTLLACGQYDTSPVIFECCRTLMKAKDDGRLEADAFALRLELLTVLNFLDAIAIGVQQKLYVKKLVKAHMQAIIARNVREYLLSPVGKISGCTPEFYERLLALHHEWEAQDARA
jgi:hypothetical protein